jgi:hypothetical protein
MINNLVLLKTPTIDYPITIFCARCGEKLNAELEVRLGTTKIYVSPCADCEQESIAINSSLNEGG